VIFDNPVQESVCDLVFFHNPATRAFMTAGISNEVLYGIKSFETRWQPYAVTGEPNRLEAGVTYHLECRLRGSLVTLLSEGVEVVTHNLPVALPQSQVGVWCRGTTDIHVRSFKVTAEEPTAFVVMQFTPPFNQLFDEVIRPICKPRSILERSLSSLLPSASSSFSHPGSVTFSGRSCSSLKSPVMIASRTSRAFP
jgi:hypothetical protein